MCGVWKAVQIGTWGFVSEMVGRGVMIRGMSASVAELSSAGGGSEWQRNSM